MKKILLSFGLLLLAIPAFLFGQNGWVKEIIGPEYEYGDQIVKTADGNFAFTLRTTQGLGSGLEEGGYIFKIDLDGNTLWNKKVSSTADKYIRLIPTDDNGFLISQKKVVSSTGLYQSHVTKLDENGEEEWTKVFRWTEGTTTGTNLINEIIAMADGGYLISGREIQNGVELDEQVRKLDANFNEVWSYTRPITHTMSSMKEADNGNIAIGGQWFDNNIGGFRGLFIQLDSEGNELMEVSFDNPQYAILDVNILPNGEFMLFDTKVPTAPQVIKIDNAGNVVFVKDVIPESQTEVNVPMYSLVQVEDGVILNSFISVPINAGGGYDMLLIKVDFDGEIIWDKRLSLQEGGAWEICSSMVATPKNGIIGITRKINDIIIFRTDENGSIYSNKIIGKVARDEQPNCLVDSSEMSLIDWAVSAKNDSSSFYTVVDSLGNYVLPIDTGDYVLSIHPPANGLWNSCENNIDISVSSYSTIEQDFSIQAVDECPSMVVNGVMGKARPCFSNRYNVIYCNQGTAIGEDAYIEIEAGSNLSYLGSSINLTSQVGNTYTFDLGDISIGECGSFYVDFFLDCDVQIGESVCIESHIYPDTVCVPNPNWN
ncbi:MAG TPA: hypothetical protein ENK52_04605, partial [Saprospiraceae bacterium]|nr:hypothetical protein [Saprospiraceae bacterium]